MNPSESGFTFAGKHCLRDFGCVWGEKDGRKFAPPTSRNSYQIAGVSGTLLLPGYTREATEYGGTLYLVREPRTMHEAAQRMREIAAWLCAGRDRLILDAEPERYYLAQVDDALQWSLAGWFGGQIAVNFVVQPYAYNLHTDSASTSAQGTSAAPTLHGLTLRVRTGEPAPLVITITCRGSAPVTAAGIALGDNSRRVEFVGLNLTTGQTLRVDMEPPAGAVILGADGAELGSALPYAGRFDYIALARGEQTVAVSLTFGDGTGDAWIGVSIRGRY